MAKDLRGLLQSVFKARGLTVMRRDLARKLIGGKDPEQTLDLLAALPKDTIEAFSAVVRNHPEIMECYALSGAFDYMLKVRASDVESYETFMTHHLLRNPHVRNVVSSFVLRELKSSTELPI